MAVASQDGENLDVLPQWPGAATDTALRVKIQNMNDALQQERIESRQRNEEGEQRQEKLMMELDWQRQEMERQRQKMERQHQEDKNKEARLLAQLEEQQGLFRILASQLAVPR